MAWADHCQMAHVFFVDLAYHALNRPTDEEIDARLMALLPEALDCLNEEGYEVDTPDNGKTVDEVVRELIGLGPGALGCLIGHGVL